MADIMQHILNPEAAEQDPEGRLLELGEWSEDIARRLAAEEGIELTDDHWEVIHFLREYYKGHGAARSGRVLLDTLAEKFDAKGGKKHLYELFPKGPVSQGSKLAGVPAPEYSQDKGFGTAV
jgi:tRNA 2-thiouridine synthesizing protein E